ARASPGSSSRRRAASRMRASTSPASLRGGRPVRPGGRFCKRVRVGNSAITFSRPHPWEPPPPRQQARHPLDLGVPDALVKERNGIVSFFGHRWVPRRHPRGARTMALQTQNRDRSGQGPPQSSGRQQAHASAWAPNERERLTADSGELRARAPAPREVPPREPRIVEVPPERESHPDERSDAPRRGLLRRHPFAFVIGLVLFVLLAAGGYLYWDYARHFESTDDAFVAARQFPIAPKVSGYITMVPVTDNQHVAAGDVIARIDDRDYRIALDQAQAQVASAQANIQNIDAQINVQQAQITAN